MGNFITWFARSYQAIIVALVAIMALLLVVLAIQHVNESKPAAGAEPGPIPTYAADKPVVAFLGDSYTAGSSQDAGASNRYPSLLTKTLGIISSVEALGGAGYIVPGQEGKLFSAEAANIPKNASVVVVYGSRNDPADGSAAAAIGTAADGLFEAINDRVPDAKIVVVGPSYAQKPMPEGGAKNAAAIAAAAEANGATYIDALGWFQNTPAEYIGADGVHPTDDGHAYLAAKFAPIIADALGQ